jgi:hypothetical protein
MIIWLVVHFLITPNQFGAFSQPQRHHKTSDQYPLKGVPDGPPISTLKHGGKLILTILGPKI